MDAGKAKALRGAALPIDRARVVQRHAELVGLQPRRDVRMALGIDIWVDAEGDAGLAALRGGDCRDAIQLAGRLRVDRADAVRDRRLELVARLPHAGEDDLAGQEA